MMSRDHIKVASTSYLHCDNSYYLRNCSTYNSPLCLKGNNIKSVFDSVIIVVVVTPYPFIFGSLTGRQLAILFWFCVFNFLAEIIVWLQGRIQNEYMSSASFNVKKCRPPWLKIFDFRWAKTALKCISSP